VKCCSVCRPQEFGGLAALVDDMPARRAAADADFALFYVTFFCCMRSSYVAQWARPQRQFLF
jgi:hypothetical protein